METGRRHHDKRHLDPGSDGNEVELGSVFGANEQKLVEFEFIVSSIAVDHWYVGGIRAHAAENTLAGDVLQSVRQRVAHKPVWSVVFSVDGEEDFLLQRHLLGAGRGQADQQDGNDEGKPGHCGSLPSELFMLTTMQPSCPDDSGASFPVSSRNMQDCLGASGRAMPEPR